MSSLSATDENINESLLGNLIVLKGGDLRSRDTYCKNILNELSHSIESNKDWSLLENYADALEASLICHHLQFAKEHLELIVELLKSFCCNDSHLITRILRTICVKPATTDLVFEHYIPIFLPHAKKSRFNFWCLLWDENMESKNEHLKDLCVSGDIYSLRKLLMIGMDVHIETNEPEYYAEFITKVPLENGTFRDNPLYPQIYDHTVRLDSWYRRRICLALNMLCFLKELNGRPKDRQVIYSCLQVMWRCLPDHYVDVEELRFVMKNYTAKFTETETNEACSFYLDIFPKSGSAKSSITPRSLKHLTRCCIRQTLRKNYAYSEGVASLRLPNCLKSYLLLGWNVLTPNSSVPLVNQFPENIKLPSRAICPDAFDVRRLIDILNTRPSA